MITYCQNCEAEMEVKYHFKPVKGIRAIIQAGVTIKCKECGHINHFAFSPTKVRRIEEVEDAKKDASYIG